MNGDGGAAAATSANSRLQRLRVPLMVLAPILVCAVGIYLWVIGGRFESTDDAYTKAATVSISANVAGRVVEVAVRDNQLVRKGAVLFRLDDAPFRIAVSQAEANLASARMKINAMKSTYRERATEVAAARDTLAFEQQQHDRNRRLLDQGIISRAQFDQSEHAVTAARRQVAGTQQQLDGVAADLGGNPEIVPDAHPDVQQAQAALDRARLDLSYTVVRAPSDGVVTKVDQLQAGDYIGASLPLFSLVSIQDVWVEANFKEVQLAHMRVGQSATVELDRFPGKRFQATVVSMSPSTGSQSSLLPPENATGNWVKVVQRVPIRLHLDDTGELRLQAGLSADVKIDTQSGSRDAGLASAEGATLLGSRLP